MFYTIFCIICTTLLGALFKWSENYKVRASAIISVNYFICFIIGFIHTGPSIYNNFNSTWLLYSIGLGCLFIIGFSFFAWSINIAGLPMATIFQKMSIILTVIAAVLLGDNLNIYQLIGLLTGIASIFFIYSIKGRKSGKKYEYFGFLLGTLLISSSIEILFIVVNKKIDFNSQLMLIFPSYIFLFAGIIGIIFMAFIQTEFTITLKEMIFGILLGIPNFYSIYFLMRALDQEMSGAIFFPTLNCSVIVLASIMGKYLFKEKLNQKQLIGIMLSMISIFLIFYFKK